MRIVDFHTHTFPDKIAAPAIKALQESSGSIAHIDGTNGALAASMKKAGVNVSVVLPVVTNPAKASHMNHFAAKVNESFEKTGIFSIGGVHPLCSDLRAVLKEAKELGLKGVKLHPDYYRITFNDIRIKRIIDIASEMGLFVITHAGMDIGLYPPVSCTIDSIMEVVRDVNPECLILAHMGGWMNWEEVTERLAPFVCDYTPAGSKGLSEGKGIYLDTAFSIGEIEWINPEDHKDYHQMSDEQFRIMVKAFGAERILFATDSPWADQTDYVNRINNMGLGRDELEMIFYKNAEKILKI